MSTYEVHSILLVFGAVVASTIVAVIWTLIRGRRSSGRRFPAWKRRGNGSWPTEGLCSSSRM